MSKFSLYTLSLWKTSTLLKEQYWNETGDVNISNNSFSCLPSHVVEDLMSCVLQLTIPQDDLTVGDLYPLVTSGRIENFKLEDIILTSEVFVSILMSLSVACHNLQSFTLKNITFSKIYYCAGDYIRASTVESLLSSANNLQFVESCIAFDLKALRNCTKLKVLKLNFVPISPLFNLLDVTEEDFCDNNSLKVLEVYEDIRHPVSCTDIAIIINYCHSLTEINCDISKSLECLHGDEVYGGILSRQYKFKKCILGSTFLQPQNATASLDSVYIASLSCPFIEEMDILVNDYSVIRTLSDFSNLNSLLVQWESIEGGNFYVGIQPLLDKIGPNLISLHLLNFFNVNFLDIGKSCPNLKTLKVEYETEFSLPYNPSMSYFHNLQSLSIENIAEDYGVQESSLKVLLSNCKDLVKMSFPFCECLNDKVLKEILSSNDMSKVKDVTLLFCNLTEDGLRNLILHLKMLDFFHFCSFAVNSDVAISVIHEINPHVIVRYDIE